MELRRFRFWPCPECVHARDLDPEEMTNRCRFIDQGEALVDGAAWEYRDHDVCPAFQAKDSVGAMLPGRFAAARTFCDDCS